MSILVRTVRETRMLVVGLLEMLREEAKRLCSSTLAEGNAVLVVFLGQGIGKFCSVPASRFGKSDDFVGNEMSHKTIEQRRGNACLFGKGLCGKSVLRLLQMSEDVCVVCDFKATSKRSLLGISYRLANISRVLTVVNQIRCTKSVGVSSSARSCRFKSNRVARAPSSSLSYAAAASCMRLVISEAAMSLRFVGSRKFENDV